MLGPGGLRAAGGVPAETWHDMRWEVSPENGKREEKCPCGQVQEEHECRECGEMTLGVTKNQGFLDAPDKGDPDEHN